MLYFKYQDSFFYDSHVEKAGIRNVNFGGIIGEDGTWIKEFLESVGFPVDNIKVRSDCVSITLLFAH